MNKEISGIHYCISCNKYLPTDMFHKNKRKPSGLQDHCKVHQRKYVENYYQSNKKIVLQKAALKHKLNTQKITKDQYIKEFTLLTGATPRQNNVILKEVQNV